MQIREAVRILLLDDQSRVLLFEGRDLADEEDVARWWFTAGGALDPDESVAEAAQRELREETGLVGLTLVDLGHRREVEFLNHGHPVHQVEHFLAARTHDHAITTEEWTEIERQAVVSFRWWTTAELLASGVRYFPEDLPDLLARAQARV